MKNQEQISALRCDRRGGSTTLAHGISLQFSSQMIIYCSRYANRYYYTIVNFGRVVALSGTEGKDELSDHGYSSLPKRYQKSDGLQVQLCWVGARRHES